jgi:hypothetical protein
LQDLTGIELWQNTQHPLRLHIEYHLLLWITLFFYCQKIDSLKHHRTLSANMFQNLANRIEDNEVDVHDGEYVMLCSNTS